ncbi:pseudouridine synthase [Aurantimonas sp. C2-6-R+9]|uniref:pseudouridine synthase n=1 Tax=unclassified Aurantimonas TaxID=2638230 RepID=UPI002E18B0D2|nr:MULTISPECIES: pseudouridine synthase [unclassified Aurantimonas]MEC5288990.1 pseudouridine synthase [Aurantimonas sp. C2-3-R2]MEC5379435.1 pseudouridine synthase [Aurantimonas sp. C2-6-R+9]MEC5410188.1 pseudouridine synthase [Aurantimonas sp. C2-4-R8]
MSDTTNGDDRKGRGRKPGDGGGARGGKSGGGGEKRPFRPRAEARTGDRPDAGKPRGDRPSSDKPRPGRAGGAGADGERKPFTPRSRGMASHGGPRSESGDGAASKPRSYGQLAHDSGKAERKPRPADKERRPPRTDRPASADAEATMPGKMRIARRLARAGIASRRDAEGMIADGRVRVNGKVLDTPALDVTAADRIEIDGAPLPAIERTRLWLFHKPAGTVTTNRDPEGRPTVFERLPKDMPRVLTVGRLDITTEGLLLLTNDGGLARILELPATGWLRRYRVRAHGAINQARLDELRQGIAIDGVFYGAIEASLDREQGSNVWLTLGLREGKNREVKRVLAHLGLDVNRLIRLSFGPFQLGDLPEGSVQEIKGRTLRDQLGDRLIEEAGADFDAPVAKPFSNKPVEAEQPNEDLRPIKRGDWISASETAPNKKRAREAKREDALGRLDTRAPRPQRGERPDRPERGGAGKRFDGPKKPYGDRGAASADGDKPAAKKPFGEGKRSANVWMAPGARPQGTKKGLAAQDRPQRRGPGGGGRPPAGAGSTGREGGDRPRGPRPPRKG